MGPNSSEKNFSIISNSQKPNQEPQKQKAARIAINQIKNYKNKKQQGRKQQAAYTEELL